MIEPVKDGERERPILDAWRPTLAAIVDSMVRGDKVIAADLPTVDATSEFSDDCRKAVEQYGDVTLVPLPAPAWESSVCRWQGERWDCLIDLWTEEEGRSDLAVELDVFEYGDTYRYVLHLVYVP